MSKLSSLKTSNAITKLKNRFQALSIKDILFAELSANTDVIEDLNAAQLEQGLRADDTQITPKYSPNYAAFKRHLGRPAEVVDLKLTGAYHKGITAKVSKYVVDITNTDSKNRKLQSKYGFSIIGLSLGSKNKLKVFLLPLVRIRYRKKLSLN
jgi:hypothetical protein